MAARLTGSGPAVPPPLPGPAAPPPLYAPHHESAPSRVTQVVLGFLPQVIFDYLPFLDLVRIRTTSVALRAMTDNDRLWHNYGRRVFPKEYAVEVTDDKAKAEALQAVSAGPTKRAKLDSSTSAEEGPEKILPGARDRVGRAYREATLASKTVQLYALWKVLDPYRLYKFRTTQASAHLNPEAVRMRLQAATTPAQRCYASFLMAISGRDLDCQPLPSELPLRYHPRFDMDFTDLCPSRITEIFFTVRAYLEKKKSGQDKASIATWKDEVYELVGEKLGLDSKDIDRGIAALPPINTERYILDERRLIRAMLTFGVANIGINDPANEVEVEEGRGFSLYLQHFADRGFLPTHEIYENILKFLDAGGESSFSLDAVPEICSILQEHNMFPPPDFDARLRAKAISLGLVTEEAEGHSD